MEYAIELFSPKLHRDQVVSIFKLRPDIFPPNEIKQIEEETKEEVSSNHYKAVATTGATVLGYCGAFYNTEDKSWEIDWFAVHPDHQSIGVGSRLIANIEDWLNGQGIGKLQVKTCSCDGEAVARAFYTKHGFVVANTEKDGYAPGHSKLTFVKKL